MAKSKRLLTKGAVQKIGQPLCFVTCFVDVKSEMVGVVNIFMEALSSHQDARLAHSWALTDMRSTGSAMSRVDILL